MNCLTKTKKHNHRSLRHYSSAELPVKKALIDEGMYPGFHWVHNYPVDAIAPSGRKISFWLDFVIPKWDIVIECSPNLWHSMDKALERDKRKAELVRKMGFRLVVLTGKDIESLNDTSIKELIVEVLIRDGNKNT
jgi:very-short-patch-repair endonuclease